MKVKDIITPSSKVVRVMTTAMRKRRVNKKPAEKAGSFVDMFGGMVDYPTVSAAGTVNPM